MVDKPLELSVEEKSSKPGRRGYSKKLHPEALLEKRIVKYYAVTELELRNLEAGNTVAKKAASTGWAFFGFALATASTLIIESSPSDLSRVLGWCFIVPACLVLSVVCWLVWRDAEKKSQGIITEVIGEFSEPSMVSETED